MSPAFEAFANELDALVLRYSLESDLSIAEAVAALEMKKHVLLNDAEEQWTEEDIGGLNGVE